MLGIVGIVSLILFLGALLTLPLLIKSLPRDIFLRKTARRERHPVLHMVNLILRNLGGGLLLIMGFIMLFIPGQGLLTMLAGLILMRFPGKTWLTHRILGLPSVQRGLNLLRRRMGREAFLFPSSGGSKGNVD